MRPGCRSPIGTDSLASAPDLGVFGELAALRALAPGVPASRLLASATRWARGRSGARHASARSSPARLAALIAMDVPAVSMTWRSIW